MAKTSSALVRAKNEEVVKLEEAAAAKECAKLIETKARLEQKVVEEEDASLRARYQTALERVDAKLAVTFPEATSDKATLKEVLRVKARASASKKKLLKEKADLEKRLKAASSPTEVGSIEGLLTDVAQQLENADVAGLDEKAAADVTE